MVRPLLREELAALVPSEYSPRLPAILLSYCRLELEAILYSDHFNDRRSSLMLRVAADHFLSLSLTDDYIRDLRDDVISRQVDAVLSASSDLSSSLESCQLVVTSLLELDVILSTSHLVQFETELAEKMEMIFAELPIKIEQIGLLPRPPIYSTPEPSSTVCVEYVSYAKIHVLLRLLFCSLHKSNRLLPELNKAVNILTESDNKRIDHPKTYSIIVRVVILVLSIIYRDKFSLAVAEEWATVPEIALMYKALLPDDDEEDDRQAYLKWSSLASEQDLDHVQMLMEYIKEEYVQESSLPPLSPFTREIWYKALLEKGAEPQREPDDGDWLSGIIQLNKKADRLTLDRLHFISSRWQAPKLLDRSLVSMRLALQPTHLCNAKPTTHDENVERYRPSYSAREDRSENFSSRVEDKLFTQRDDLVAYYAEKGREYMANKESQRKTQKRARYMRNTVQNKVNEVSSSQRAIERELDEESDFLARLKNNDDVMKRDVTRTSPTKAQLREMWDEAIRTDLDRLNRKLEQISRHLHPNSMTSSGHGTAESREMDDEKDDEDLLEADELEDVDQPSFNYDEALAATSFLPETLEKLDFGLLSPLPSVGNRISTPASQSTAHSLSETDRKKPSNLSWMRLLPLDDDKADRKLLTYRLPERTQSDRGQPRYQKQCSLENSSSIHPTIRPYIQEKETQKPNFIDEWNSQENTNEIMKPEANLQGSALFKLDLAQENVKPSSNSQISSGFQTEILPKVNDVKMMSREDVNAMLGIEE